MEYNTRNEQRRSSTGGQCPLPVAVFAFLIPWQRENYPFPARRNTGSEKTFPTGRENFLSVIMEITENM
ncbi:MAG: hypothetical protein UEP57_09710 [Oscillospiraceae bacterium]|nr:hypothetical protein [Oscillospiraceae bacterium]